MKDASSNDLSGELTQLLQSWSEGHPESLQRLVPLVIDDLRRLAQHHLRALGSTPTLQPTVLVNEAYLRLAKNHGSHQVKGRPRVFLSRTHFFAFASKLISYLLIDYRRRRQASKRGSGLEITAFVDQVSAHETTLSVDAMLEVHDLLTTLKRRDPRRGQVVELRFFVGLTMPEVAEVTGRSLATVERDWQVAQRWLAQELQRAS